ncbi:PAS and ANTAR domain-containing protein [Nocardia yamanashiensis]|uniref:PAS and ANTAR domain-containing protein n=1 Tax=Nocardia yamanashiensis TaxID=209247 RepID=UPI001E47F59E|nr:PAS and ANTAR domain-containing protein [Nocardia yamanashiensis]UGT44075.1 PAS and ANTAR domain-containing protein [Nocardia yamanashiensis]
MELNGPVKDAVEQVVAAGVPEKVGSLRFWFGEQRWEWSDEVARLHGYEPGEAEPTTELLLSHKHPEDRGRVEAEFVASVRDHGPFSSRHRIVDRAGDVHHVIVVSRPITDGSEQVIGTEGFMVDVSDVLADQHRQALNDTLPVVIEQRAVIEQAKGMLMLVYSLSEQQAFRVLRWRSQETNLKLREIATRLVERAHELPMTAQCRSRCDHLLLTLHL